LQHALHGSGTGVQHAGHLSGGETEHVDEDDNRGLARREPLQHDDECQFDVFVRLVGRRRLVGSVGDLVQPGVGVGLEPENITAA